MPAHRKEVFHNNIKTCISNCFHTEIHRGQHFHIGSSRYSWEQAVFGWHHKNTVTQATTCYYGNLSFYRCWMAMRLKTPFGDLLVKTLPIFARSNKVFVADAFSTCHWEDENVQFLPPGKESSHFQIHPQMPLQLVKGLNTNFVIWGQLEEKDCCLL